MKQSGMTFVSWRRGEFDTDGSARSFDRMLATGINAVALVPTTYQQTHRDVEIDAHTLQTSADSEVTHVITAAKARGLYVMVKPHVDLSGDDKHWRGDIGRNFTEAMWAAWFANYSSIIVRYAELAQRCGADLVCVGTELKSASGRELEWREIVRRVRQVFGGKLIYAANHDETGIAWWDVLDFIGVDAYYSLGQDAVGTTEELIRLWHASGVLVHLERMSRKYGKQVILTEIGYRSIEYANVRPFEWRGAARIDVIAQAMCYEAALRVFAGMPWVEGMYWWNWLANPDSGGVGDTDYTPAGKPAEAVLRKHLLTLFR